MIAQWLRQALNACKDLPDAAWGLATRLAGRAERVGVALGHDPVRTLVFALFLLATASIPPLRHAVASQSERMALWASTCPTAETPQAFDPWRWAPCFAFAGSAAAALRELISWLVACYCAWAWLWLAFETSGDWIRRARAIGPLLRRARARRRHDDQ